MTKIALSAEFQASSWKFRSLKNIFRTLENGQKNPRVRKIRVRNSGAGNGCANFMDARKKCVHSAGKTMSIKFLVLGGGVFWVLGGGGGSADFIFMGARIFLKWSFHTPPIHTPTKCRTKLLPFNFSLRSGVTFESILGPLTTHAPLIEGVNLHSLD